MKPITLALAGNPNCGKTTLYNRLTGANRHVGNFPGVTVDCKSGAVRSAGGCTVVDLPGLYSLHPYTEEERVARDFLLDGHPDGIVNIVDASHMERGLYLTIQLLELQIPTVIALNMMDEVKSNGGAVDVQRLSRTLGVKVIPISAARNDGIDTLIREAVSAAERRKRPAPPDFYREGAVSQCLGTIARMLEPRAGQLGLPARFCAIGLLEGDDRLPAQLSLTAGEQKSLAQSAAELEKSCGTDAYAALASMRYSFLEKTCRVCLIKGRESREHRRSVKLDRVLTHRFFALPLFFCIIGLFFFLTFGAIGPFLQERAERGVDALTMLADRGLTACGVHPLLHSLLIDGIFAGVGSVVGFLPIIVVLFFFLSILEDSGYMARVVFITDGLFRRIGLSGRSFVPMLIGFGCTVPAAMAARTLPSERDRRMTILLTPYISCSAKIPIYTIITAAFFRESQTPVILSLYLGGLLLGILVVRWRNRTASSPADAVPFLMELPDYRMPSPKSVFRLMWDKAKDFLQRAFTIILLSSLFIWFLQNFDSSLHFTPDSAQSLLAAVGSCLVPIFRPLGFSDWRIATSLLVGITAKEAVISTMSVLYGTKDLAACLFGKGIFTPPSAAAFLVFTLLYTPCVASVAVFSHELHSKGRALGVAAAQCAMAWLAAWLVFRAGSLFA